MAKRCASAAILDTLRDPRVVTMAPAAQTLWIRLVTAMQHSQISVLKFGSDIMNLTGIALFIQIAETEIETHLQTVIDRGLLCRDSEGAIVCPMLAAAVARFEVNRINGSKGGRPRKDAAPPGQREILYPIKGGLEKTQITKTITESETEMATGGDETSTYLLKEVSNEVKVSAVSETEFHETGKAALDAAGFDPAKGFQTYGLVRQWLADGADRAMILDVIQRKTGPKVTTLAYFSKAIAEAIAAKPAKKPDWEKAYDIAMSTWELVGRGIDPMPRVADFKGRVAA